MDPEEEFVQNFFAQKQWFLSLYFSESNVQAASRIRSLNLSDDQLEILKGTLDSDIRDTMYTFLLALDGEASINGSQQLFKLFDENNFELTKSHMIEAYAYEYFHVKSKT